MREWGCPFCIERFVQKVYFYVFKPEDFYEPHLIRHIGRKHGEQTIPVSVGSNAAIHPVNNLPSAETCASLVPRLLCTRCGHTFLNRSDLKRHSDIKHQPIHCHHCNKTFFGYNQMKAHEMKLRSEIYMCRCGASFARKREFNCGYCGIENPSNDHISSVHWKRLNKSVRIEQKKQIFEVPNGQQFPCTFSVEKLKEECSDTKSDSITDFRQSEIDCSNGDFSEINSETFCVRKPDTHLISHMNTDDCHLNVIISIPDEANSVNLGARLPKDLLSIFPELWDTREFLLFILLFTLLIFYNSLFLNVYLTSTENKFADVVMIDSFSGSNRFLSVHIPVQRPPPMVDANKWLTVPIYV
uniref:C2H2-type domain-containing protein n=1 Tax=Heterorhabditis bacteriophora TaxID=37862 RepID=A0A1I7XKH5_HETBA